MQISATEILKSLVLAGINSFCILDDALVQNADLVGFKKKFFKSISSLFSFYYECFFFIKNVKLKFQGNNFFLHVSDLGRKRGEATLAKLKVGFFHK